MSSGPKIGRAFEKAGNALAFQARKLHEQARSATAAPEPEEVLNRLRRLGEEFANERPDDRPQQMYRDEQMKKIQPLLDRAHEYLEDGDKARKEAQPILDSLASVDWQALRKKFAGHAVTTGRDVTAKDEEGNEVRVNFGSMFSTYSTSSRIGLLQRAYETLRDFVNASDSELRSVLNTMDFTPPSYPPEAQGPDGFPLEAMNANGWLRSSHAEFRYSINALLRVLSHGPSGESIRGMLAGIKKLISEIGADVFPASETSATRPRSVASEPNEETI